MNRLNLSDGYSYLYTICQRHRSSGDSPAARSLLNVSLRHILIGTLLCMGLLSSTEKSVAKEGCRRIPVTQLLALYEKQAAKQDIIKALGAPDDESDISKDMVNQGEWFGVLLVYDHIFLEGEQEHEGQLNIWLDSSSGLVRTITFRFYGRPFFQRKQMKRTFGTRYQVVHRSDKYSDELSSVLSQCDDPHGKHEYWLYREKGIEACVEQYDSEKYVAVLVFDQVIKADTYMLPCKKTTCRKK